MAQRQERKANKKAPSQTDLKRKLLTIREESADLGLHFDEMLQEEIAKVLEEEKEQIRVTQPTIYDGATGVDSQGSNVYLDASSRRTSTPSRKQEVQARLASLRQKAKLPPHARVERSEPVYSIRSNSPEIRTSVAETTDQETSPPRREPFRLRWRREKLEQKRKDRLGMGEELVSKEGVLPQSYKQSSRTNNFAEPSYKHYDLTSASEDIFLNSSATSDDFLETLIGRREA